MTDQAPETQGSDHVTIIREGRSSGGMFIALLALVIIVAVSIWLVTREQRRDSVDASISQAAEQVGDAAQKVGNAADNASKHLD